MTKERKALKLALEKFEFMNHVDSIFEGEFNFQINAIKEALAQPEQEPVAWMYEVNNAHTCLDLFEPPDDAYDEGTLHPLYTTPPQRTWVGLTDEDKSLFSSWLDHKTDAEVFEAIEAKLKEKNT